MAEKSPFKYTAATNALSKDGIKKLLKQYAGYNMWANEKITTTILQLPALILSQEMESSFSTIFKTVQHILDAESIWWQRIKLAENIDIPSQYFTGNFKELQQKLLQQSALFEELVNNANEYQLLHVFAFQRNKLDQQKQAVYEALLHLFNHGTYHRGQLVTMLRHVGVTKIPATDFFDYLNKRKG